MASQIIVLCSRDAMRVELTVRPILTRDNSHLDGSIPWQLGNLIALSYLDLGNNPLDGSIPWQLGELTEITYLALYRAIVLIR